MNIRTEIDGAICTITIDRPKALNALNAGTLADISKAIEAAEKDENIRVVILTGGGEKAFVAGADIKEFANHTEKEAEEMSRKGHTLVFNKIENLSKPVIAAINGFALGGGLELALACHIRYASDNAKLGLPEVTLGLIPGYGGTQRLPRLVGKGIANEMIFSARMITAERAKEVGLVNEVFSAADLMAETKKLAFIIAKNSPRAISKAIEVINEYESENGFEKEIIGFGKLFSGKDKAEGVNAFLEKRKPNF